MQALRPPWPASITRSRISTPFTPGAMRMQGMPSGGLSLATPDPAPPKAGAPSPAMITGWSISRVSRQTPPRERM